MITNLPPDEIERRRAESIRARADLDRAEFEAWYQEQCDREYWRRGKCCAGCDHWTSAAGMTGECDANGILPSADVLASMGIVGWSGPPVPGFPWTRSEDVCGKFSDSFDWPTLDSEYLERIGAMKRGKLREKP